MKSYLQKINPEIKKLIIILIVIKIIVWLLILCGQFVFAFAETNWWLSFLHPEGRPITLWSVFITWDAQHYTYLADIGYSAVHPSNAFYPLFPWMISLVKYITLKNSVAAGYLVANIVSIMAVIVFYQLSAQLFDKKIAWRSCLLLIAFPTGFLLHLLYSEPLFLLITFLLFQALYQERYWLTAGLGLFVPLARAQGILLAPVLAWRVLIQHWRKKEYDKIAMYCAVVGTSILFGFYIYLFYMQAVTGDMFAGFSAQQHFVSIRDTSALFHPVQWFLDNFIRGPWSWIGVSTSVINRVFFIFYLLMLPLVYRKCDSTLFFYTLAVGMVPALTSDLAGFPRYLLLAFPIFFALAKSLSKKGFIILLILFGVIQIVLMQLHCLNYWFA